MKTKPFNGGSQNVGMLSETNSQITPPILRPFDDVTAKVIITSAPPISENIFRMHE